jgi:hypothetical protein
MSHEQYQLFRKNFRASVGGIVEDDQKRLLMVRAEDGWGIPAGHIDTFPEVRYPKISLECELIEETPVYVFASDMVLWAILGEVTQKRISIGFVYQILKYIVQPQMTVPELLAAESNPEMKRLLQKLLDEDIQESVFLSPSDIASLLRKGEIRKPKWNVPVLERWLSGESQFVSMVNGPESQKWQEGLLSLWARGVMLCRSTQIR